MISKNQVKYIQSLGQKKSRDTENKFIAEGPKIVSELLNAGNCKVIQVFGLKEWIEQNADAKRKIEIIEVSNDELNKISQMTTPSQVLGVVV